MGEPVFRMQDVDVYYGEFHVLWNISLAAEGGHVVSMIGSNGAGKSTLLNTISGVMKPARGSIFFHGKEINGLRAFETVSEGISLVPEGRRLFTRLTVLENLEIGSYLPHARKKKEEMVQKVCELFPVLQERRNQLASTLSGGEQQMLAIGRALMSDPRLILFDEISLGLAPLVIRHIYQRVKKVNEEGITVVVVEQDIQRSLKDAHYVYIIQEGRIRLQGRPAELSFEDIRKAYFGI